MGKVGTKQAMAVRMALAIGSARSSAPQNNKRNSKDKEK